MTAVRMFRSNERVSISSPFAPSKPEASISSPHPEVLLLASQYLADLVELESSFRDFLTKSVEGDMLRASGTSGISPQVRMVRAGERNSSSNQQQRTLADRVWTYGTAVLGGLVLGLLLGHEIGAVIGGLLGAAFCIADGRSRARNR